MTRQGPLITALVQAERRLVDGLALVALPLEPAVAFREGQWKGARVVIQTRAYRGAKIRYARFAEVVGGGLEIGNLLCLPDERYPLPLLGADLVQVRDDEIMIAVDLSPMLPGGSERDRQLEPLARRRAQRNALPSGGTLPAWCANWFSPFALYTRVGLEQTDAALEAFQDFPEVFLQLTGPGRPRAGLVELVADRQDGYLRSHCEDDRGLKLLGTMFGPAWAERYVNEVLFPRRADDRRPGPGS